MRVSIVIPLYNQVEYTKICLESLLPSINPGVRIVLVDNGSSDATAEYLANLEGVHIIKNPVNLGCAAAWNQGVGACDSDWIVILNNDVILPSGWLDGLITFAEEQNLDIVSPAIREGEYNYDIGAYSSAFMTRMRSVKRAGVVDGICFMVRRQVFEKVGLFDEMFRIGQFEDKDFFRRAKLAGFRLGTTGRSFIHHFGSITQKSIKRSKAAGPYEAENRAYYRKKWQLFWLRRFVDKRICDFQNHIWSMTERIFYRHSLKEKWMGGKLHYY